MSRSKSIVMWSVLAMMPIVAFLLLALGYYAYAKLTYSAYVCGSFATLDSELGWVLKPSTTSCLGGRKALSSEPPWFEAPVFTDVNGFRAAHAGDETPSGGIMIVGDSYTFGYGVSFEQSYPGALQTRSGIPIVVAASPAYSSAQALLLAERWQTKLRPRAIVFLEMGQWERDACRGSTRPSAILKPCYWQPPGQPAAEIVLPPPRRVLNWARWGILPGGMIGPGEITWPYFLVSRPVAQVLQILTRIGLLSGFPHDFAAVAVDTRVIRLAVVHHIGRLAQSAGVPLILIDPHNYFDAQMLTSLPLAQAVLIHPIGKQQWDTEIAARRTLLPVAERSIPNDEHFGVGTNRLVAELLHAELRKLRVLQ